MRLDADGYIELGEDMQERLQKVVKISSQSQRYRRGMKNLPAAEQDFYADELAIHHKVVAEYQKLSAARRELKKLTESYEFIEIYLWDAKSDSPEYRKMTRQANELLKEVVWEIYQLELIIEEEML